MQKIMTSTALLLAGALLLSGCAAGGGGAEASASADPCAAVRTEVRDVSNGAQNALASGDDPADVQASLEGYSERVDALDKTSGDDQSVSDALDALGVAIDDAAEFASTLPTDPDPDAEVDADAVAEHQTAIQEAAAEVSSSCDAD
jgi:hypothetical protein